MVTLSVVISKEESEITEKENASIVVLVHRVLICLNSEGVTTHKAARLLPLSNEGYVFTGVCDSVHRRGGWYPSMYCRSPGPHPGGKLRGLATGDPGPHTGGSWGVGSPGPHLEGGISRPTPGGYPRMHCGRHPPPRRGLLLLAVRILLECILVLNWNWNIFYFIFS